MKPDPKISVGLSECGRPLNSKGILRPTNFRSHNRATTVFARLRTSGAEAKAIPCRPSAGLDVAPGHSNRLMRIEDFAATIGVQIDSMDDLLRIVGVRVMPLRNGCYVLEAQAHAAVTAWFQTTLCSANDAEAAGISPPFKGA
jgi:hypothetical protein